MHLPPKKKVSDLVLDFLIGTFQPLIGVITGGGLIKTLLTLLTMAGWMDKSSDLYQVMFNIADATFYFLPVMIALREDNASSQRIGDPFQRRTAPETTVATTLKPPTTSTCPVAAGVRGFVGIEPLVHPARKKCIFHGRSSYNLYGLCLYAPVRRIEIN